MKGHVAIGNVTKSDAFRMNGDQAMNPGNMVQNPYKRL